MPEAALTPRQVVETWVERFNKADVDGLAALYAEEATNHQIVKDPVKGRAAIRAMFEGEFANAEMTCLIEVLHEMTDGKTVALEWRDPNGLRGCGFFTIEGGQIVFQRGYFDQLSFLKLQNLPIE